MMSGSTEPEPIAPSETSDSLRSLADKRTDVDKRPDDEGIWPDGGGPVRLEPAPALEEHLIVDVGGFEGPLDLLLELARHHKIDLAQISILALADQYLAYIERARRMCLELAADYLVMAAWLAFLKSRLLIPAPPTQEDVPAEDMAKRLAFRLQRLQAMRDAAARLMNRNLLGRDVYARGQPEALVINHHKLYGDSLIDLLKAYTVRRQQKQRHQSYIIKRFPTFSIKTAREALERLVGEMAEWSTLDHWLELYLTKPDQRRSARASSFTASLELAREGVIEIRQDDHFQPLYMRRKSA